ncbi:hypothetical protein V2J09_012957 [Rumex salicifolius]
MWGVLVKCLVWNSSYKEAVLLFNGMVNRGVELSGYVFPSILRACAGIGDLRVGEVVHGSAMKRGFEKDDVVETALMSMYGEVGSVGSARKLFDEMSVRDVVSWSSMVQIHAQNGQVKVDRVTMLSVAQATGDLGCLDLARSVHGYALRQELASVDGSLENSLLLMIEEKNIILWNMLISVHARQGLIKEAMVIYKEMQVNGISPDTFTLSILLSACDDTASSKLGYQLHGHVIKTGESDEYVQNSLIDMYSQVGAKGKWLHGKVMICGMRNMYIDTALTDMYAKCGEINLARRVFDTMKEKSVASWSAMIAGYGAHGHVDEGKSALEEVGPAEDEAQR